MVKQVNLEEAIVEISLAQQECPGERHPFFFIIGAGISSPSIPLSSEIVDECHDEKIFFRGCEDDFSSDDPMEQYSHWLYSAYPHTKSRQNYLRSLVEGKPLSAANLRLAHLLAAQNLTNLVVTSNFDDHLSKALQLFGIPHIVCDHPQTVDRIDQDFNDIQVVHVHGTYWFYDCCNVNEEIEDRAQPIKTTTQSMLFLLDKILFDRSPLVIGYAGWEKDVIMTALQRRLENRTLPWNCYWFCHQRRSVESLPEWLTLHPNVVFVVPEKSPPLIFIAPEMEHAVEETIQDETDESALSRDIAPPTREDIRLSARQIFDHLIREFAPESPKITTNPLGFFADQLEASLPTDQDETDSPDIYAFSTVIKRVRTAEWSERTAGLQSKIHAIQDAVRQAKYKETVDKVSALLESDADEIGMEMLTDILHALDAAIRAFKQEDDYYGNAADLLLNITERHPDYRKQGTEAFNKWIKALFHMADYFMSKKDPTACTIYREIVQFCEGADDPSLRLFVAKALRKEAYMLANGEFYDEAIERCNDLISQFSDSTDIEIILNILNAKLTKSRCLILGEKQIQKGIDIFIEIIKEYEDHYDRDVLSIVNITWELLLYVKLNLNKDKDDNAFEGFDFWIAWLREKPILWAFSLIAEAMLFKGEALVAAGNTDDALITFVELVETYQYEDEETIRDYVKKAKDHLARLSEPVSNGDDHNPEDTPS